MAIDPIIRVAHLTRTFQRRTARSGPLGIVRGLATRDAETVAAVNDVSFEIAPGEMVGYIGQNGAGKSTTIKMLTGILTPSGGDIEVLGVDPARQRKRLARRIGVVFGQRTQLWWDLPLRDSLDLLRHMYRVPESRFRENLGIAREVLELDPFLDTPVRQLSLGQRMRGDLAAAILHDPALLVLDEPTIGLDLLAKDHIRAFLRRYNEERGVTMLLTTHDLGDIERLCDRVIVIDRGRLQFDGSATALRARFADRIEVTADFASPPIFDETGPGVTIARESDLRWRLAFDTASWTAGSAVRWLTTQGELRDIAIETVSLEHVVRQMYRGATTGVGGGHVEYSTEPSGAGRVCPPGPAEGIFAMAMTEHRFQVPDMSCRHCEQAVKAELLRIDGVHDVDVNLDTKTVTVKHDAVVNTGAMREAINDAGYTIEG